MAFTAALRPNYPTTSSPPLHSKVHLLSIAFKQKRVTSTRIVRGRGHLVGFIKSGLDNRQSSINGNGATEPAGVPLEKIFAQTQKLEDQKSRYSQISLEGEPGIIFESDLQAVLTALKKKEEDLQNAERMVVSEHSELNNAKEELKRREQEIIAACSWQEKLEEELKHANLELACQAREIEDLRLHLQERDQEITSLQSALSLKEDEMEKMRNELAAKSEEAAKTDYELKSMAQLLDEANDVVEKQKGEVQELKKAIQEKEEELDASVMLRKLEKEKLKAMEANLEKQTMEWLLAQQELKKLVEGTSLSMAETNETLEDFERVKNLLAEVRSELVSSQKLLSSSRQKMEDQEQQLEKLLVELEQQKMSVMSYMTSLKNVQIEVESERVKLRIAEARNEKLEQELSMEEEFVEELHLQLNEERSSLLKSTQETSFLRQELDQKFSEFGETHSLLKVKESELVEAKLEIQHLKSERDSLRLILAEKDAEIIRAREKLEHSNQEVSELKQLMNWREDELTQATTLLREKEKHVQTVQHELGDAKLKSSEAEAVVERIVELTQKVIVSSMDEDFDAFSVVDEEPNYNFKWQKIQLETELQLTRENLKLKETELFAAQRALIVKDEEHKAVLGRLDAKEKELKMKKEEMAEEANDLKNLYAWAQERIGERSIGDLATEKLQLEAAQLEVEAVTSALHKLTEMSRALLDKASSSIETDTDTIFLPQNGSDLGASAEEVKPFPEVEAEVARLSSLTEQLLREAGIVGVAG